MTEEGGTKIRIKFKFLEIKTHQKNYIYYEIVSGKYNSVYLWDYEVYPFLKRFPKNYIFKGNLIYFKQIHFWNEYQHKITAGLYHQLMANDIFSRAHLIDLKC